MKIIHNLKKLWKVRNTQGVYMLCDIALIFFFDFLNACKGKADADMIL